MAHESIVQKLIHVRKTRLSTAIRGIFLFRPDFRWPRDTDFHWLPGARLGILHVATHYRSFSCRSNGSDWRFGSVSVYRFDADVDFCGMADKGCTDRGALSVMGYTRTQILDAAVLKTGRVA
jgi:hypothetical protein